jgi:hypothetical protein
VLNNIPYKVHEHVPLPGNRKFFVFGDHVFLLQTLATTSPVVLGTALGYSMQYIADGALKTLWRLFLCRISKRRDSDSVDRIAEEYGRMRCEAISELQSSRLQ